MADDIGEAEVVAMESMADDDDLGEEELEALGHTIDVSKDVIQAAVNSGFTSLVKKVRAYAESKASEIKDYQSTIEQFSDTLNKNQDDQPSGGVDGSSGSREQDVTNVKELENRLFAAQEAFAALTNTVEVEKASKEALEQDLFNTKEQLLSLQDELQTTRSALQLQLSDAYSQLDEARHTIEDLTPPPDIPGADRQELLRLLDRRQQEITRLSDEWKGMSARLEAVTKTKGEYQSKLDELMVQDAALKLREQLLEQEKNFMASQNEWLSEDLNQKTDELLQLKKEKATLLTSVESTTTVRDDEITHLKSMLKSAQKSSSEVEAKLESCLKKLKDTKEEHVTLEEQLRKELSSQSRLTELYQASAEEAGRKVSELMEGVEKLQVIMEEVTRERDALSARLTEEVGRHAGQEEALVERVGDLEQELVRANELLGSGKGRAPGGLPDVHPGMTVTQLYSHYVSVCEQLEQEKEESAKLNNSITQIVQELDEKTPALQQLRLNYDTAVKSNEAMTQKLALVLEECEGLRYEAEDAVKQSKATERENQRLKSLTSDLSRQVQVLLKECEDARGGVSSMSHYTQDTSTDDISSSSQVISEHLVTFRNIEELQHQNQKLLAVVRELSEEKEQREAEYVQEHTKGLKEQLDSALREVDELREARERQKAMVEAIVKQRDMYRVLLAQSTPLPEPPKQQVPQTQDKEVQQLGLELSETRKALQDIQEQFTSYRKERKENDNILRKQVDEMREQASALRLDNVKVVSKLEYANERYQLLEAQCSAQRKELEMLRDKNQQLSSSLSKHQNAIASTTQDLITAKDKLARAEMTLQGVTRERDMLVEESKRLRTQYENVMREQRGHSTLLTNLQAIQNNLERTEFETKSRQGVQFESLQKEVTMLKEKLNAEEDRRARVSEAYEREVKTLEHSLASERETHARAKDELKQSEEQQRVLSSDLAVQRELVSELQKTLRTTQERVVLLEQDPGAEFRQKIRLLEHQLADANTSVVSLENQLEAAKKQREYYQGLCRGHEEALEQLNRTSEVFKTETERMLQEGASAKRLLQEDLSAVCQQRDLALEGKASLEQLMSGLQEQVKMLEAKGKLLQSELTTTQDELRTARDDAKRFAKLSTENWEHYQKELVQHGKSVEGCIRAQEELKQVQNDLQSEVARSNQLQEQLSSREAFWAGQERSLKNSLQELEQRCSDLQGQNTMLHEEAEKLSNRLVTLQRVDERDTPQAEGVVERSSEQLWEVVRYVRREKNIADTKREIAEAENLRNKQLAEHLQRQLQETKEELKEVSAAAKSQAVTNAQHSEILAKVETLNLLTDSNRLLREEKDRMYQQIRDLEVKCQDLGEQLKPLREANKSLLGLKDNLLAEKAALKNEVARWSERTTQLIEQYNKVDPEEYKRLLEERDVTAGKLNQLQEASEQIRMQLSAAQQEKSLLESSGQQKSSQLGDLTTEMDALRADNAAKQKDLTEKTGMITKLRDVGRKYRSMYDDTNKKLEELKKETDSLKSVVDKQTKELEAARQASVTAAENTSRVQELADAQKTVETLQKSTQEQEEKVKKLQAFAAKLKQSMDKLKHEKDQLAEEAKNEKTRHAGELERLQQRLDSLQCKYDTDAKLHEDQVNKLQQQLRDRPSIKRKVALPPAVQGGQTSVALQTAPTAAVKPTLTTTPTASIRPLPALVTMAPTAHVTPTVLTVSTDHGNSHTAMATMFVRQVSPQVITSQAAGSNHPTTTTTTTTVTPSTITATITSIAGHPAGKRKREDPAVNEQESVTTGISDSKKPRHVAEEMAAPSQGGGLQEMAAPSLGGGLQEMDTHQEAGPSKQLESALEEEEQLEPELVSGTKEGLGTAGIGVADKRTGDVSGEQLEGHKTTSDHDTKVGQQTSEQTASVDRTEDQMDGMTGILLEGNISGDRGDARASDDVTAVVGEGEERCERETMAGELEEDKMAACTEDDSSQFEVGRSKAADELEEGEIAGQNDEDVIVGETKTSVTHLEEDRMTSGEKKLGDSISAQLLKDTASHQLLEGSMDTVISAVFNERQLSEEKSEKNEEGEELGSVKQEVEIERMENVEKSQEEEVEQENEYKESEEDRAEGEEEQAEGEEEQAEEEEEQAEEEEEQAEGEKEQAEEEEREQEVMEEGEQGEEEREQELEEDEGEEGEIEEEEREESEGEEEEKEEELEEREEEVEEREQEAEEQEGEEGEIEEEREQVQDERSEGEEDEEGEGSKVDPIVIESESETEVSDNEVIYNVQDLPREEVNQTGQVHTHRSQGPSSEYEELPDDEPSVDITTRPVVSGNVTASRPTYFTRSQLQQSLFSGERSTGAFQGLEMGAEDHTDHTVPHTPVLEGKLLENKAQIIPSLNESTNTTSHVAKNTATGSAAIQSMGETQVELQGQVVDEPGNLQQVAVSQEPQSFADMGAVEELMETVSDDEGSITRGGSGLEDEEGRQDLTGPQSVPGTSDSTIGRRDVSPGGSESSVLQQRKRKPQPIIWDGPPAVPVPPVPPRAPNPPRAVARRSRGRGAGGESRRAIQFKRGAGRK